MFLIIAVASIFTLTTLPSVNTDYKILSVLRQAHVWNDS